jgi:hypothetical protein
MTSRVLLDDAEELPYFKQLLINPPDQQQISSEAPAIKSVIPKPGFCIKTRSSDGKVKVFINVCKSDSVPAPKQITDEELFKLLESEDPSGFRIPMSLGEAHDELDNSGKPCKAYDIVINSEFFETILQRDVMRGFLLTVTMEGLEAKYSLTLDRNWSVLKNRKFLGSLPEQNIRTVSKPWIMEMNDDYTQSSGDSAVPTRHETKKGVEPPYTLIQEPAEGHPEYIVAQIHLPLIKAASSLVLDVGEDRIVVETRSNVYTLDIYLAHNLLQDDCVAQFNRTSKILTITMPVQPLILLPQL